MLGILTGFQQVPADEVEKVIRSSSSSSCELDALPTTLLKQCLPEVINPLTRIVNLSLENGTVPT